MNQKELEAYMDAMWAKYSSYERSGVLMKESKFHAALREVLQHAGVDVQAMPRPEVKW